MVNTNLTQVNMHLNSINPIVNQSGWIEMNKKFNNLQQQLTSNCFEIYIFVRFKLKPGLNFIVLSRKLNSVINNTTTIKNTTTITIDNINNSTFQEAVWNKITDLEKLTGFLMEQLGKPDPITPG